MADLDKIQVRRSFQHSAAVYDQAAVVQRRMADELIDRLRLVKIAPAYVIDVGCGTGYALPGLQQRFPEAHFIMLDFASNMLQQLCTLQSVRLHPICADAESMPIASHSVDIIFCNAALQWCSFDAVFNEFLRVLKPQGLLTFATFGPDTLKELRAAWRQVDADVHVHDFTDMHNIGDALVRLQFTTPVLDVDYVTVTHRDLKSALFDLKILGARNAMKIRNRGLLGRRKYQALEQACEAFRNVQGLLESTCEIIYGHAWAPGQLNLSATGNEVAIPLSLLHRR